MKKYIFLLSFLCSAILNAQNLEFASVIPSQSQTTRNFEDYLVQLAWYNSPGNAIYKKEVEIAAKKANMTHWEWLKDANISFNLNEGNLSNNTGNENIFFPRYNFGVSLNLGSIATRPLQTKIAKEAVKIAELEEKQQMFKVRAEVLQRYEDHKLAVEVLKSKTQASQEAESVYTLVSEQFKNGKIDFKDYNTASMTFYDTKEAVVIAQAQVNKSIILLEELIGIPWKNAVKRRKKKN